MCVLVQAFVERDAVKGSATDSAEAGEITTLGRS
jgi:hypothetical protein